jgi:hypothetical protein
MASQPVDEVLTALDQIIFLARRITKLINRQQYNLRRHPKPHR